MQLIRDVPSLKIKPCVATIGNFDGLHCGHQAILSKVTQIANALNLSPTVITFEPSPRIFFNQSEPFFRLTTLKEKLKLLKKCGISQVICLRFNAALAKVSPEQFIAKYLVHYLQVRHLIVGEDFRFGFKQAGDVTMLENATKQFPFTVEPMVLKEKDAQKVSSTAIRQLLQQGECIKAKVLLGHYYALEGVVIKGRQQGRKLGFATANMRFPKNKVPLKGVFVTQVEVEGKQYAAVSNVGTRPTVDGKTFLIESHLFNFTGNLYDKVLKVFFLQKIRDEMRFDSLEALRQQIENDVEFAQCYLNNEIEVDSHGL